MFTRLTGFTVKLWSTFFILSAFKFFKIKFYDTIIAFISNNNNNIKYKPLSLTYKVLTTNQPHYLHDSISVQPCHNTRSSSMVTLAHPPTRSSLKITNRSFRYAAPSLWNELPTDLRESRRTQSPALSPITHGISSSSLSPLASSLTRSVFHSELETWLFSKSFPP